MPELIQTTASMGRSKFGKNKAPGLLAAAKLGDCNQVTSMPCQNKKRHCGVHLEASDLEEILKAKSTCTSIEEGL